MRASRRAHVPDLIPVMDPRYAAYTRRRGEWETCFIDKHIATGARFEGYEVIDGTQAAVFGFGRRTYAQLVHTPKHFGNSESWEEKTTRWRKEFEAIQARDRKLARLVDVRPPLLGHPLRYEAHGKTAVLNRLTNSPDYFLKIEGENRGRFGSWDQIKADLGYFKLNGVLPRAKESVH